MASPVTEFLWDMSPLKPDLDHDPRWDSSELLGEHGDEDNSLAAMLLASNLPVPEIPAVGRYGETVLYRITGSWSWTTDPSWDPDQDVDSPDGLWGSLARLRNRNPRDPNMFFFAISKYTYGLEFRLAARLGPMIVIQSQAADRDDARWKKKVARQIRSWSATAAVADKLPADGTAHAVISTQTLRAVLTHQPGTPITGDLDGTLFGIPLTGWQIKADGRTQTDELRVLADGDADNPAAIAARHLLTIL